MEFDRDFVETLERIEPILTNLGLPHFFTGGIVAALYGEPRMTQDADIVLRIQEDQAGLLVEALEPKFLVDRDDVLGAIRKSRIFQAIDLDTMVKVDFHIGEAVPGEFDRIRTVQLFSGSSEYPVVSKEDAILSKLLWIQKGSHKSRADVVAMLFAPDTFDLKFVREMAEHLGVKPILEELWNDAHSG